MLLKVIQVSMISIIQYNSSYLTILTLSYWIDYMDLPF